MFSDTRRRFLHRMTTSTALLVAAVTLTNACGEKKAAFSNIDITGSTYANDFALNDHNGQLRKMGDFAGKVVVLFFGFTQCPDVCPTTMLEMAEVKKALGKDGERVQTLFVTLDPERDTAQVLKAYMENFDPASLALIPTLEQLPKLAKDFKVYYGKVEGKTPSSYTMDHSAFSYIYDTQGRLRLFSNYGGDRKLLTQDIALLLKE